MKNKLINILVIVLIILTLIPLNIFGAEYPAQDVIDNFDENLISDIDTTTLENWVDILKNGKNYPSGRITVTGEEVRKKIEKVISNRKKVEEVIAQYNSIGGNLADIDTTNLYDWVTILKDYRNYQGGKINETGKKISNAINKEISSRVPVISLAQDIIDNFDENLSDIDTTTLENWVDILKNGKNYPSGRITVTGEEVRKKIEEEISNRKKEEEEESWLQDIDKWKPSSDGQSHTKLTTLAGKILGVIQVVGSIASVAVLSILGIKYMCASLEEKAAYKQTMILYIVGCIMVFGISNIAKIIYDIAITL